MFLFGRGINFRPPFLCLAPPIHCPLNVVSSSSAIPEIDPFNDEGIICLVFLRILCPVQTDLFKSLPKSAPDGCVRMERSLGKDSHCLSVIWLLNLIVLVLLQNVFLQLEHLYLVLFCLFFPHLIIPSTEPHKEHKILGEYINRGLWAYTSPILSPHQH